MKKFVLAFVALAAMGGLVAAQGMRFQAIGPLVMYDANFYSNEVDDASVTTLRLGGVASLALSDSLELDPELSVSISNEANPSIIAIPGLTVSQDYSRLSFSLGAGVYKTMLNAGALSFKIGPKTMFYLYGEPFGTSATTYDKYFSAQIEVSLPLMLDINLSSKFAVRISQPFASLGWYTYSTTLGTLEYAHSELWFETMYTGLNPTFSCLIKF